MSPDFQLREFLPYRINRLAERISRSLAAVYGERFGISVAQWRIIATLQEMPGLAAKEVGMRCHLDKVKVSRAVTELEGRKLLRRRRLDDDRRASELHLTKAGMRLFESIANLAVAWESELLLELSAHERELLKDLIEKLDAVVDGRANNALEEA